VAEIEDLAVDGDDRLLAPWNIMINDCYDIDRLEMEKH
jgi:hypothetical protein